MALATTIIQKLIQIPLCRGLSEEEAAVLFEIAEETSVPSGQSIFREGDPGDAMYAILEGRVEVTKRDPAGGEVSLATLSEGSVLGEMCLVGGAPHRSASAIARTDLRLLKVPASRFEELLAGDHLAAFKFVLNLSRVMSRRLQVMNEKVVAVVDRGKKREELKEFHKLLSDWSF